VNHGTINHTAAIQQSICVLFAIVSSSAETNTYLGRVKQCLIAPQTPEREHS